MPEIVAINIDPRGAAKCDVELPRSKSVALRAMTLNAVSERISACTAQISGMPDAEDVKGMERALRCYRAGGHFVNIGEGGAPFRFFTSLAASTPGIDLTLATRRPLLRRPHSILLEALGNAGAEISALRGIGRPPLRIIGRRLDSAGISIDPGVSSQYISALMMVAPMWISGLRLNFNDRRPVSYPYLQMTAKVMEKFGCSLNMSETGITVSPSQCKAPECYPIPVDWSAASYLYEFALINPGTEVRVADLTPPTDSLQGDSECMRIFERLGVTTRFNSDGSASIIRDNEGEKKFVDGDTYTINLGDTPDLAPALAVGFCLAGIRFKFNDVAHLRHKETNRMAALATELRKLGYHLWTADTMMGWNGVRSEVLESPLISTYSDHRMAMAFAPAAALFSGLRIENPGVVAKSFPRYWEMLGRLGGEIAPLKNYF